MEILKPITKPNFDLSWIASAFREAISKPTLMKKITHLKYRLLWELRPILKWAGSKPLAVDAELASVCNFRCSMCQQDTGWYEEYKAKGLVKPFMEWDIFKKIVDECVSMGVYSMKVNWRGEPMLHPHFVECIIYMKDAGIHEVMMNSNASKLTEELADKLILSGIDRIIFSCDGISKETYNKIRVGGDWDKFILNVKMFARKCHEAKALGIRVPSIRINASIQEANRHEIPQFRGIFNGWVDELRFNTIYSPQSKLREKRQVKRLGCPQIYQRMIVSSEGDGIPCCADYLKKLSLGNIGNQSLRSMYRNTMGNIRRLHESHHARILDGCKNCDLFSLSEIENGKVIWN